MLAIVYVLEYVVILFEALFHVLVFEGPFLNRVTTVSHVNLDTSVKISDLAISC